MTLSCTRATVEDTKSDEFKPDFYLSEYLKEIDCSIAKTSSSFDDNASMIVHNASLMEMNYSSSSKSQPSSMNNVGKQQDFLKRFMAFRQKRKSERLSTTSCIKTFSYFDQIFSKSSSSKNNNNDDITATKRIPQALFSTTSHFDISTVERRIELSELDRRNSIGN